MKYGQFCPVAKASGILGERWTLLIVRDVLRGITRFNEFQRKLAMISPTLLNKRSKSLEEQGLVLKNISDWLGLNVFAGIRPLSIFSN